MTMIVHPHTKEIVSEDMFLSYPNWQSIKFLKATDCEEIETGTHFILKGKVNGREFESKLTVEQYFNGANFYLNN